MKSLRRLILANAAILLALGIGIAFNPPLSLPVKYEVGEPYQSLALVHLLAMALAGLAAVVMMQSRLSLTGELRRLALALGLANGLISLMAFFEQIGFGGSPAGWLLILAPLAMAAALAWMGWRPLRPAEIAAEVESLKIPDEIRQALLQQVGEAAAQEERNRLARDLHDSIKQQLFSINVGTAAAQERWERDPEGARKALADVRRSAREAMVEMQAMLHQLRPEALGTAGLIEALREQCEALGYRTGAEVTLELGEPVPDDRMPPGAQDALFRIGQEMLANVARHARARHVRLWLGRQNEEVMLRIVDDGQGFDPAAEVSGMGLRNLRERAAFLKGSLEVTSTPGAGTRILIWVPLLAAVPAGDSPVLDSTRSLTVSTLSSLSLALVLVAGGRQTSATLSSLAHVTTSELIVWSNVAVSWWTVRNGLRRSPGAGIVEVARLHYVEHRGQALLLFAGAWLFRQSSHIPGRWGAFSGFTSFLCLVLMGLKIFRVYRWSRPRRRLSEGWAWPAEWGWPSGAHPAISVGGALLVTALAFVISFLSENFWSDPEQFLFFVLGATVLAYFLWRRPRMEGDPA